MSKKQLALNNFKKQLDELGQLNYHQAKAWKSFTKEIIIKYLGEESRFLTQFISAYGIFYDQQDFVKDKQRSRDILIQCIKFIELNGAYKDPNSNFISRMSEGWAIFWVGALVSVFSAGGYFVGTYTTSNKVEREKINLQVKVDSLEKQQSLLMIQLAKNQPAPKPAQILPKKMKKSMTQRD